MKPKRSAAPVACPTCRGRGEISKIGDKLRRARDHCGISRKTLADAALLTENTITNIEMGLVSPQSDTIVRLTTELEKRGADFSP